jgi:hypothetical protein
MVTRVNLFDFKSNSSVTRCGTQIKGHIWSQPVSLRLTSLNLHPSRREALNRRYTEHVQGDQKVSVHLMITTQKVTSNVQSVPRQSPDIY